MTSTSSSSIAPSSVTADPRVFQRATTVALVGLTIQGALSIATGLVALWSDSQAVYAAGWHMLGGLPIWIMLAVVYSQHESERTQRLAADKLAADSAATAAIFGNLSDDLDAARRRLDNLYRFGLPTVSVIVAIYLLGAGGSLAWVQATAAAKASPIAQNCSPVGLLFAMAGIAFVAFIGGRWLAGYGKQRAWQLLRGGASYLMSCFVIALLVMAGVAALAVVDAAWPCEAMAYVIPSVMVAIGLEILLTTLLESYRPRVPGEIPRPAFDSRVLGLLTAPESLGSVVADLISYQFGVEVSGSWLYRLLSSALTPLTIFGAAVLVALSSVTIIGPDERGVLLRWGALEQELPPGIHLKLPWPVETVEMHPVGEVQQLVVSTDGNAGPDKAPAILWTTDDDRDAARNREDFVAAPSEEGGGVSLVSADVTVQYTVADLETFLLGSSDPREALKAVAQREATEFFACHDIDSLLSRGRTSGGPELRQAIQARVDQAGLGIKVVGVAITSIHPPIGTVSRAFHNQIGAMQQRETWIQRAHKNAVEQLAKVAGSVALSQQIDAEIRKLDALRTSGAATPQPAAAAERPVDVQVAEAERRIDTLLGEARGEAAEILHTARSYRWKRSVGERADGERFAGELLAFQASPDYYRARRFLEVLAEGLSNRRKFIITGDAGDTPVIRMDFNDPASAIDMLLNE